MSLISSNIKEKILTNLNDIINFQDNTWNNLDTEIKFKIIHNLCNLLKKNSNFITQPNITTITQPITQTNITTIAQTIPSTNIPLKNLRPKKLIQFCGINKQMNSEIYDEFRKNIINVNRDFRTNYNSNNKNYCFANLSKNKYECLLNNYNYNIYCFLLKNINIINYKYFYSNLLGENQQIIFCEHKKINNSPNKIFSNNCFKIKQINYKDKFLNIEFNNNISLQMELYLTSEKITNNIPAKYKINLINIF